MTHSTILPVNSPDSPMPATWQACDMCDEFVCTVHDQHASDCPCPALEDWVDAGFDPYLSPVTEELQQWLKQTEQ